MDRPHDSTRAGRSSQSKAVKQFEYPRTDHTRHHGDADRSGPVIPQSNPRHRRVLNQNSLPYQPPLSQSNNYVRSWLAQTEAEMGSKEKQTRRLNAHYDSQHQPDPQAPQLDFKLHKDNQEVKVSSNNQGKARRQSKCSSDSSLLDAPMFPETSCSREGRQNQEIPTRAIIDLPRNSNARENGRRDKKDFERAVVDDTRKRHGSEISKSRSSTPIATNTSYQKDVFEKRKRHRTREDRYELKRLVQTPSKKKVDKPNRKRIKKGDASRATKKAGEDLMRNFSSKNVSNERLTLRPPASLGIFNNGRVSSSGPRRGLPDLAFSEMEVLRNSRHSRLLDDDPIQPATREKVRKHRGNLSTKTSNFFTKSRSPLKERFSPDIARRSESPKDDPLLLYTGNILTGYGSARNTRTVSQHIGIEEQPAGKSGSPQYPDGSSPSLILPFAGHNSENTPLPISQRSGPATTYVTWSESDYGQLKGNPRPAEHSRSPTPESIRISIEKTGIYRHTGIVPHRNRCEESGRARERQLEQSVPHQQSELSEQHESPEALDTIKSAENIMSREREYNSTRDKDHLYRSNFGRPRTPPQDCAKPKRAEHHVTIETNDPQNGWENPSGFGGHKGSEADTRCQTVIRDIKSAQMSREDIAKLARIRRPSTTLPVMRNVEKLPSLGLLPTVTEDLPSLGGTAPLNHFQNQGHDDVSSTMRGEDSSATLTNSEHITQPFSNTIPEILEHDVTDDRSGTRNRSFFATGESEGGVITQLNRVAPTMEELQPISLNKPVPIATENFNMNGIRMRSLSRLANVEGCLKSPQNPPRVTIEVRPLYAQQLQPRNQFTPQYHSVIHDYDYDMGPGAPNGLVVLENFDNRMIEEPSSPFFTGPGGIERERILETFQQEFEKIEGTEHLNERDWLDEDPAYDTQNHEPWHVTSDNSYGSAGGDQSAYQQNEDMIPNSQYPQQLVEQTSNLKFWQPHRQY